MITVEKSGKIYVPQEDGFIGYTGDNLNKKVEFLVKDRAEEDIYYRVYLAFDDGTVNFFILDKKIEEPNTLLEWNVKTEHIYKDGIVCLQIKGFDVNGEIFHTESVPLFAGKSLEFCDCLAKKPIAEFLEQEEKLNSLLLDVKEAENYLPYIGSNGNWFVYNGETSSYYDTGITAKGSAEAYPIVNVVNSDSADGNVPSAGAVFRFADGLYENNREEIDKLNTKTGDLSYLITEDKTDLVSAVNEIENSKINNTSGAVSTDNLADLSVTEGKIAKGAVTSEKLGANAVTNKKISDGEITLAKISSAYIDSAPSVSAPYYGECLVKSGGVYNALQKKYNSSNIESGSGTLTVVTQTAIDSELFKSCDFEYVKIGDLIHTFINIVFNAGSASFLQLKGLPFTCNDFSTMNRFMTATSKTTQALVYNDKTWLNINFLGTKTLVQDEVLKFVITTKLN